MENIKICEFCGFETSNGKIMSNHKRWKHITPKGSSRYSDCCEKLRKSAKKANIIDVTIVCPECGTTFIETMSESAYKSGRHKHFCSSVCAHKQGSKNVDYSKVSKWAKEHLTGCFSPEYRAAHPSEYTRFFSKRELEIVKFFKENFPDDGWQQGSINGPSNRYNGLILTPDLYSKKLKVVIEYDGIWHFEDIHGQLQHKHDVDCAMLTFCTKYGYRLIRVDEDLKITNEKIAEAVYNSDKALELFDSKRYGYLKPFS